MSKLYLVRHGKTSWNEQGLVQGLTNIPLNEEGINKALDLAENINLDEIDVIISSPLIRAYDTAKIITRGKKEIIIDERIMERCFGDIEGSIIDFELIDKIWDYNLNYSENHIESMKDILKRAKDVLDDIKVRYKDKNVLLVTHGAFMKALHFNIIGYDENTDFISFFPDNTTLYEYKL